VCGVKNKLNYAEFNELISSFDILGLTETKTNESDTQDIQIPGFVTAFKNRTKLWNIRSGGIMIAF
jgi:hypothetical protein